MGNTDYAEKYRNVDFRKHPEKYVVGIGEQGVLIAEPYTSEIQPYWRFATPEKAQASAEKIYAMFEQYRDAGDFVGMDMARKFLQMGWTRSRRYANHSSGRKYAKNGDVHPQDETSESSLKAKSAAIFKSFYDKARQDSAYKAQLAAHRQSEKM